MPRLTTHFTHDSFIKQKRGGGVRTSTRSPTVVPLGRRPPGGMRTGAQSLARRKNRYLLTELWKGNRVEQNVSRADSAQKNKDAIATKRRRRLGATMSSERIVGPSIRPAPRTQFAFKRLPAPGNRVTLPHTSHRRLPCHALQANPTRRIVRSRGELSTTPSMNFFASDSTMKISPPIVS